MIPFSLAVLLVLPVARSGEPCATGTAPVVQDLGMAVAAPPTLTETSTLLQRLEEASQGAIFDVLANESTDAGFTVVHIEGEGRSLATKADAAKALARIGVKARPRKDFPVFQDPAVPDPDMENQSVFDAMVAADPNAAPLVEALKGLKDLKVMVIGADSYSSDAEHGVYILGTAPDGSLVGVKSTLVWT